MTTIEDLNKTQLVLLTLLISFVSSIATGIITTSLLAEAPVSVTQTINRVVERTIETVAPTGEKELSLNSKDKELLAAVNKANQSVVSIEEVLAPTSTSTPFSFQGIIATKDGMIVSSLTHVVAGKSYVMVLGDNSRIPLRLAATSTPDNVAIFRVQAGELGEGDMTAQ